MSTSIPATDRAAKARSVNMARAAERAADDPVRLARAARIVRVALARQDLSLAELTGQDGGPDVAA